MTHFTLTPQFQLQREASGQLHFVDAHGQTHVGAVPVRAFPLAAPDECISLVSLEGRELVWIERLADLPDQTRALLQEELALRDFIPEIRQLKSVSSFGTPSVWTVETDRGPMIFVLKGEEDIRRLGPGLLIVNDAHGVQYLIQDLLGMDKHSRKLLDRFL